MAIEHLTNTITEIDRSHIVPENSELLIVDDDRYIVQMLTQAFELEGFRVAQAYNGRQALDFVYNRRPSLIILDLMMPVVSGFEVCKELKTQRGFSNIPIIMLTAKKELEDKIIGLRIGANEYITKPFELKAVSDAVWLQLIKAKKMRDEEGVECHAEFVIDSDFEYITQINDLIMRMFEQTNLSEEDIMEFEYCLNEALMNAIEHGSEGDPQKKVIVSYTLKKDALILSIEDEGEGFDFTAVPDPTTPENILNPRGRGIFIMKQYMDRVDYNEKGTRITLTKYLYHTKM